MLPSLNARNYINCYKKINHTNYNSITQISEQKIQNVDMQKLHCVSESFKKSNLPKIKILKSIQEWLNQTINNSKAFGISQWGIIKSAYHLIPPCPMEVFFSKLKSRTTLATIPLKERYGIKTIQTTLEKIEFEEGIISYVLKNKGKQLGYLNITKDSDNISVIFMTNILGRKKYRNIENVLLQGMVEDCMKQGFVPNIKTIAINVGNHMGHGYDNEKLYRRMGMESSDNYFMNISAEKVSDIINKRKEKFGSIINK